MSMKKPLVTAGVVATGSPSAASGIAPAAEALPSWVKRAPKKSVGAETIDPRPSGHAPTILISVPRVAEQLGISVKTVRRLIKCKQLNACRIGRCIRVDPEELQAYIQRYTTT